MVCAHEARPRARTRQPCLWKRTRLAMGVAAFLVLRHAVKGDATRDHGVMMLARLDVDAARQRSIYRSPAPSGAGRDPPVGEHYLSVHQGYRLIGANRADVGSAIHRYVGGNVR